MTIETRLIIVFLSLLAAAITIVCYPILKKRRLMSLGISLFVIMSATLGYWYWGAWTPYTTYTHQQILFASIKNPQELIDKIKVRLQQEPQSVQGWFLLGRLYMSQNQWSSALDAFEHAHHLSPNNEQITINYVQSMWQQNSRKFKQTMRQLLQNLLQKNTNQPDALSMLAMDAFQAGNYAQAIEYWKHLLSLVPPDSTDAQTIRNAIAKARDKL